MTLRPDDVGHVRSYRGMEQQGGEHGRQAPKFYQRLGMRADTDFIGTRLVGPAMPHVAASSP